MSNKQTTFQILRIALGVFFIVVGAMKLSDLDAFTTDVANYQLPFLQAPLDAIIAYTLPWFEIVAGLLVAFGHWGARGGLVAIIGSFLIFNAALISAWVRGLEINCGCFGKSDDPTNYPLHVSINFALIILATLILWHLWHARPKSIFGKQRLMLPS